MKLAEANFKRNPITRETCRSSKASMRLPEDDSSPKALFLLITKDLYDFESIRKAVRVERRLGFDLVKKVWE